MTEVYFWLIFVSIVVFSAMNTIIGVIGREELRKKIDEILKRAEGDSE